MGGNTPMIRDFLNYPLDADEKSSDNPLIEEPWKVGQSTHFGNRINSNRRERVRCCRPIR